MCPHEATFAPGTHARGHTETRTASVGTLGQKSRRRWGEGRGRPARGGRVAGGTALPLSLKQKSRLCEPRHSTRGTCGCQLCSPGRTPGAESQGCCCPPCPSRGCSRRAALCLSLLPCLARGSLPQGPGTRLLRGRAGAGRQPAPPRPAPAAALPKRSPERGMTSGPRKARSVCTAWSKWPVELQREASFSASRRRCGESPSGRRGLPSLR